MEIVTFTSHSETLTGHLYLPTGDEPAPAVTIIGPMTYIKEQAPTQYARRLAADHGFAALVFDCRYHGESSGEPRRWEQPMAKVEDIRASLDFLVACPEIDAQRLTGLGVCQGSSEMIRALADDPRFKAGATVAGHYRDLDGDNEWLTPAGRALRLERGWKAKLHYERSGEVQYVPGVDERRMDVGMPGKFVWDWYHLWEDRGWDNRYAVMSDADLLDYESLSAAARLDIPHLMIHSDQSFLPAVARRHFASIPSADKRLLWEGDTPHLAYYDNPELLDATTAKVAAFLAEFVG